MTLFSSEFFKKKIETLTPAVNEQIPYLMIRPHCVFYTLLVCRIYVLTNNIYIFFLSISKVALWVYPAGGMIQAPSGSNKQNYKWSLRKMDLDKTASS